MKARFTAGNTQAVRHGGLPHVLTPGRSPSWPSTIRRENIHFSLHRADSFPTAEATIPAAGQSFLFRVFHSASDIWDRIIAGG